MGLNLGCSWANLIGFSLTRLYSILAEKIIYLNTICMIMGQAMAPNAIFPINMTSHKQMRKTKVSGTTRSRLK